MTFYSRIFPVQSSVEDVVRGLGLVPSGLAIGARLRADRSGYNLDLLRNGRPVQLTVGRLEGEGAIQDPHLAFFVDLRALKRAHPALWKAR